MHKIKHKYTQMLVPPNISKSQHCEELKTLYYSRKMMLYIITSVLKDYNNSYNNQANLNSDSLNITTTTTTTNNNVLMITNTKNTNTVNTANTTPLISTPPTTTTSTTNSPHDTQNNLISYTTAANESTNNKHQSDLEEVLFTYIQKEIEYYSKEILGDIHYKPNTMLFKQFDYMIKDIFISLQYVNLNTRINILKRTSFNVIQVMKKSSVYVQIEIMKYLQLTLPYIYPSDIPPGVVFYTTLLDIGSTILYDYDMMKKKSIHLGVSDTLLLLYDYIINTILILLQSEKWNSYLIDSLTTKFSEINKAFKDKSNSIKAFAKQNKQLYNNLLLLFDISGSYDCFYYNHCSVIYNGIKGELINYKPNENDCENVGFKTSIKTEEINLINTIPVNKVNVPFLPELYGKEEVIKFIDTLLFSYIKSGNSNGDVTELLLYSKLCKVLKYQTNNPIICSKLYEFKTFDIFVNHISDFNKYDKLNSQHDILLKYYSLYKLYIESHFKNSENLFKPFEEKEKPISNPIQGDTTTAKATNNNNTLKKLSKYDHLIAMGFKSKLVRAALRKNRSLEDAVEWILGQVESEDDDEDEDKDEEDDEDEDKDEYSDDDDEEGDGDDEGSDSDGSERKKKKRKKGKKNKNGDDDSGKDDSSSDDNSKYNREEPELDLDNKRVYIYI